MATTDSGIKHKGAISLGEALKTNMTLTELDLACVNKIRKTVIWFMTSDSFLSKCHSQVTKLEMLESQHCAKHWRTTQHLLNSILTVSTMDDLVKCFFWLIFSFPVNNIGNAGSTSLCELLKVNPTLKTINFVGKLNRQWLRNMKQL